MLDDKHRTTVIFKGKALDIIKILQQNSVALNSILSSILIKSYEDETIFKHTGMELGAEKNKKLIADIKKLKKLYENIEDGHQNNINNQ